jgi:hypothetical protein
MVHLLSMKRAAILLLLTLTGANVSMAANITYNVSLTIGAGSVTGSIVTDGKIGVLSQADIIGYSLVLSDPAGGTTTFNLSCCNFFPFQGSDLSATATQLLFNFSGTDSGVVDFADPSDAYDVCFSTSGGAFGPSSFCEGAGETLTYTSGPVPIIRTFELTNLSGTQVIAATAANITYYVNLTIGSGTVTGNIVTDGKIGVLSQADIVGWNLLLNDGPSTWDLACCRASILFGFSGSDLSATTTQLLFNFSGTDNGTLEISDGSLDYDLCFSASTASQGSVFCNGGSLSAAHSGETITFMTSPSVFNYQFTGLSGTQVIATTTATAPSGLTMYSYQGNPFTIVPSPYTTSDFVSGFFTAGALAGNLTAVDITSTVLTYSFTDGGVNTITQTYTGEAPRFVVSTDPQGDITSWDLTLTNGLPPSNVALFTCNGITTYLNSCPNGPFDESYINNGQTLGRNNANPGTWSASTVPSFFNGAVSLGSGVYYLQFPNGNPFGYYNFVAGTIFYHYDMGYEAFVQGSAADIYLYDFTSLHWLYTSSSLFPYLYDFTLSNWLYYFPDTKNPGHYTTNPRYFSNLTKGTIFTM